MLLSRKRSREASGPTLHPHAHDRSLRHRLQTPQQRAIDEKWFLRDLLDAFDDSRALEEQSQRQILEFLQRHNQCLPEPSAQAMELSRAHLSSQELFLSVVLEWQRSADTAAADALQVQRPQFISSRSNISSYESSSAESSRSEPSSEEDDEEEDHVRTRHSSRITQQRSDDVSPTSVHSVPRDHLTSLSLDSYSSSSAKMIGIYSPRARQELLRKYMTKRAKRLSQNTVRYRVRKTLANARPRVKGRFVKTEQPLTAALVEAMTKISSCVSLVGTATTTAAGEAQSSRRPSQELMPPPMRNKKRITADKVQQWMHFAFRLTVLLGCILYVFLCVDAAVVTIRLLQGYIGPLTVVEGDYNLTSAVLPDFLGSSTLRQSPLIKTALGDSTVPINQTLYLAMDGTTSFSMCSGVTSQMQALYGDAFLRSFHHQLISGVSYNATAYVNSTKELIAPVVDCSSGLIKKNATTMYRVHYLMRSRSSPDDVYLLTGKFATQAYDISNRNEKGPLLIGTLSLVNDLTATTVDHTIIGSIGFPLESLDFEVYLYDAFTSEGYLQVTSIPPDAMTELPKALTTARRVGFFMDSESEQANINNKYWTVPDDPTEAIVYWVWMRRATVKDSWAWVHLIHLYFGLSSLSGLAVLAIVFVRNKQRGKLWIGDASVAVLGSIYFQGPLVLLSWYMNRFWSIMEFSITDAHTAAGLESIVYFDEITRLDLLSIYWTLCQLLGFVLKDRIDPAFTFLTFEIGFEFRVQILEGFSALQSSLKTMGTTEYFQSVTIPISGQETISAMRLWSTRSVSTVSLKMIFTACFPMCFMFVFIVLYILLRKIYRHYFPDKLQTLNSRNTPTDMSHKDDSLVAAKRVLTIFEIATGRALETHYGVVANYKTHVVIKGLKFASADGIYSSGFVIANNKYLVRTDDVASIALMKLSHWRFKNVYVYELTGTTVQQTARLVYPDTLTWSDLSNLNISVLS